MMNVLSICVVLMLAACPVRGNSHKIVGFWGQNAAGPSNPSNQEKPLKDYCHNETKYDILSIGCLTTFFDTRNQGSLPGFDFSNHCSTSNGPNYPYLLHCPAIGADIAHCQTKGKKVLLSIGGVTGDATLPSPAKAREFANTVWDLVLGGTGMQTLRVFGSNILDGVVLDFQGGQVAHHPAFVSELRRLMDADTTRHYIIAAMPKCTYPDYFLGPAQGKVLGDVPQFIDAVFVQYLHEQCDADNSQQFWQNAQQWVTGVQGPTFFVGLPAHPSASSTASDYQTPAEVAAMYSQLSSQPAFGGFTLWDTSFDTVNIIDNKTYSTHLGELLSNATTTTTTSTTPAPTTQAGFSCSGKADGNYPHPTDCSKFYVCTAGTLSENTCPAGLKFNPAISSCDWPANFSC